VEELLLKVLLRIVTSLTETFKPPPVLPEMVLFSISTGVWPRALIAPNVFPERIEFRIVREAP
jgi:hypothetical protein